MSVSWQRGLCTLEINEYVASVFSVDNQARDESTRDSGNKVMGMEITMIKRIIM